MGFTPVKIISLILSQVSHEGQKRENTREKTPDHLQADLGLSHMWPELGWNPQRWDDEEDCSWYACESLVYVST